MVSCSLTRINIDSGPMPEPDSNLEIVISFTAELSRCKEDPTLSILKLDVGIKNDEHRFYEVEAQAEAVFRFPDEMEQHDRDMFAQSVGAKEAFSAIRAMLDSVTTHFVHGAIRMPDMDVSKALVAE